MLFKILHRFTRAVLFEREADSLKLCVAAAVETKADLATARDAAGPQGGLRAAT